MAYMHMINCLLNLDGSNPSLPPFAFAEDSSENKVAVKDFKTAPNHSNDATPTSLSLLLIADEKQEDNDANIEHNTEHGQSFAPAPVSLSFNPFAVTNWRKTKQLSNDNGVTETNGFVAVTAPKFATSTGENENESYKVETTSSQKILKRINVETVPVGSLNVESINDANTRRSINSKNANNGDKVNYIVDQMATVRTDDFLVAMVSTTEHSPVNANTILNTTPLKIQQANYEPQAHLRKGFATSPRANQEVLTENILGMLGNPISELTTQNTLGLRTTITPFIHGVSSSPQKPPHISGLSQALPLTNDGKHVKSDTENKKKGSGPSTLKKLIKIRKIRKRTQLANQLAAKTKPVRSIQSFDVIDGNIFGRSQFQPNILSNVGQNLRSNLEAQFPSQKFTSQNAYSLLSNVAQQPLFGQKKITDNPAQLNLQRESITYRQIVNPQTNTPLVRSVQGFSSRTVPSSLNGAVQNVQISSNNALVGYRNLAPTSQNYIQNIYSITRTLAPPTQSIKTINLAEGQEKTEQNIEISNHNSRLNRSLLHGVNRAVVYDRLRTIKRQSMGLQRKNIHSNRKARVLSAGKTVPDAKTEVIQENNLQTHHQTHEGEVRTNQEFEQIALNVDEKISYVDRDRSRGTIDRDVLKNT
uniref:BZIP domain-containing protein n=1 Tax=Heterorhabditis bacteriophora TaxID=37862 RepID=A0A1I7WRK3_HETBA